MHYDADYKPLAKAWLAVDEDDRVAAIDQHHEGLEGVLHDGHHPPHLHARMHLVVENQAAEGLEAVVRTLDRLTGEGVRRHAAVHMIIGVLTETFAAMAVNQEPFDEVAYGEKLDALDAGSWIGARMRRDLGPVDV